MIKGLDEQKVKKTFKEYFGYSSDEFDESFSDKYES